VMVAHVAALAVRLCRRFSGNAGFTGHLANNVIITSYLAVVRGTDG
jgi:hypothetical protein